MILRCYLSIIIELFLLKYMFSTRVIRIMVVKKEFKSNYFDTNSLL